MTSLDAVRNQFVNFARQRQFKELLELWHTLPAGTQKDEQLARLATAAFAETGDQSTAFSIINPIADNSDANPATLALAGRLAGDNKLYSRSATLLERALTLEPNQDNWLPLLAESAHLAGRPNAAIPILRAKVFRRLHNPSLALIFAQLLADAGRIDEAFIEFERLLHARPNDQHLQLSYRKFVNKSFPFNSKKFLTSLGDLEINELNAQNVNLCFAQPGLFESQDACIDRLQHLLTDLQKLGQLAKSTSLSAKERLLSLSTTNFFGAYFDADVTSQQNAWGDFLQNLVEPARAELLENGGWIDTFHEPRNGAPVKRVGFVSNRLNDSSAGRFFNEWCIALMDAGFEVRLYAMGHTDKITEALASRASALHTYDEIAQTDAFSLGQQLVTDANDVLIFPEPQGSPSIMWIAAMRYAPIQIAGYGNPLTTGLKTMDYFACPLAAESVDAQALYREQLLPLPGMGIKIGGVATATLYPRVNFGFSDNQHLYLAAQPSQKWSPYYIDALIQIVKRDPSSMLIFFANDLGHLYGQSFETALRHQFKREDVDFAKHTRSIGTLKREDYLALMRMSDVFLDTFCFSGGSSTFDAMSVGLPVVTYKGPFLRSRQSAGMLQESSLDEFIASTHEQFVSIAVQTANFSARQSASVRDRFINGALKLSADTRGPAALVEFVAKLRLA